MAARNLTAYEGYSTEKQREGGNYCPHPSGSTIPPIYETLAQSVELSGN